MLLSCLAYFCPIKHFPSVRDSSVMCRWSSPPIWPHKECVCGSSWSLYRWYLCSPPKIAIALKTEFRQRRSRLIPYVNLIRWCLFLARLNYQPQQTRPPHGPTQKIVHTGVLRLIAELCAATEQYFNYNSVYLETGIIMRRTRFPTVHTLNTSKHTKVCLPSDFLTHQSWFVSLIHLSYR